MNLVGVATERRTGVGNQVDDLDNGDLPPSGPFEHHVDGS